MDDKPDLQPQNSRNSTKSKLIGKLFGKEKRLSHDAEIAAFLNSPSDELFMNLASPSPTTLPKLDTATARRWPTAAEVNYRRDTSRGRSASPKRSRKGLIVRFKDTQPEVIGEGGDEADTPPSQISVSRRRAHSHPSTIASQPIPKQEVIPVAQSRKETHILLQENDIHNLRRTPTGFTAGASPPTLPRPTRLSPPLTSANTTASPALRPDVSTNSSPRTNLAGPATLPSQLTPGAPESQQLIRGNHQDPPRVPSLAIKGQTVSKAHITTRAEGVDIDSTLLGFSERVRHLYRLFHLSAEAVSPLSATSTSDLLRLASWWFLRGRGHLEIAANERSGTLTDHGTLSLIRQQGHVDLAKTLWLSEEVIAKRLKLGKDNPSDLTWSVQSPNVATDGVRAEELERHHLILTNMHKLIISMARNKFLPPDREDVLLPQGLDTSIWIRYPDLPPELHSLLTERGIAQHLSVDIRSHPPLSESMPLRDTAKFFNYTRMFVDFLLIARDDTTTTRYPCILFLNRRPTENNLYIQISSQDGLIYFSLQPNQTAMPSWESVRWDHKNASLLIKMSTAFTARLQCSSRDYRHLWSIYDENDRTLENMRSRANERIAFETTVKSLQYFTGDPPKNSFPTGTLGGCKVRIFEGISTTSRDVKTSPEQCHLRIACITSPKNRALAGLSHEIPTNTLIEYDLILGDAGFPAVFLRFGTEHHCASMVLTFVDLDERSAFHQCINGGPRIYENERARISLKEHFITYDTFSDPNENTLKLDMFDWQTIKLIEKRPDTTLNASDNADVKSGQLRIVTQASNGSITDPLKQKSTNLGFRLKRDASIEELAIFREAQKDLSIAILKSKMPPPSVRDLSTLIDGISKKETVRRYRFSNVADLHIFQEALYGYHVVYDAIVSSFTIARRRVVVHKRLETFYARLQVLTRVSEVRLVGFFENFKYGSCISFTLDAANIYETFNKGDKFCLRINDARFTLPKMGSEDGGRLSDDYVFMDQIDPPEEHDDIIISFHSESERERFASILPAPVKATSRMGTVRK